MWNIENTYMKPAQILLHTKKLLVVGLGNPSPAYDRTRHNVGNWFVDQLVQQSWSRFSAFRADKRAPAFQLSTTSDANYSHITLAKSVNTYMNVLGQAVAKLWKLFQKEHNNSTQLLIVHDELDRDIGKVHIRSGKTSPRGHNGLKSINAHLGQKYTKLGIGIGRPPRGNDAAVTEHVLSRFLLQENDVLERTTMERALVLMEEIAQGKLLDN